MQTLASIDVLEVDLNHILLIDDDLKQLWLREAVLNAAGFKVARAASAESALALLRSRPAAGQPDAIITDHLLPGASGAQFVMELRGIHPHVPVFVLTGLSGAETEYDGLNVTFLEKPCAPEHLIRLLREALAGQPA